MAAIKKTPDRQAKQTDDDEHTTMRKKRKKTQKSAEKPLEEMETTEETHEKPSPSENERHPKRETEKVEKTKKIPPVVLRNADDWTTVCKKLKAKKINYAKAQMTMNGVAITPSSTQDYRNLTKLLNDNKKEYHTYALPEDKTTRAVIKGVQHHR